MYPFFLIGVFKAPPEVPTRLVVWKNRGARVTIGGIGCRQEMGGRGNVQ